MSLKYKTPTASEPITNLQRVGFYEPLSLREGDLFRLVGDRSTRCRFIAHVTNVDTGEEWLECWELEGSRARAKRSISPRRVGRKLKR